MGWGQAAVWKEKINDQTALMGDVVLFWLVLCAFLVADNFVLLPEDADYLRFDRQGLFTYEPKARLEIKGRDLVILNPLNLFDRIMVTSHSYEDLIPAQYRAARKALRSEIHRLNVFSMLGTVYLAIVVLLAVACARIAFEWVFLALILTHVLFCILSATLLFRWRNCLGLSRYQTLVLTAEALFVPAYCINLAKRLRYKRVTSLAALPFGLRQAGRMKDLAKREVYVYYLKERIAHIESRLTFQLYDGSQPCSLDGLVKRRKSEHVKQPE